MAAALERQNFVYGFLFFFFFFCLLLLNNRRVISIHLGHLTTWTESWRRFTEEAIKDEHVCVGVCSVLRLAARQISPMGTVKVKLNADHQNGADCEKLDLSESNNLNLSKMLPADNSDQLKPQDRDLATQQH